MAEPQTDRRDLHWLYGQVAGAVRYVVFLEGKTGVSYATWGLVLWWLLVVILLTLVSLAIRGVVSPYLWTFVLPVQWFVLKMSRRTGDA